MSLVTRALSRTQLELDAVEEMARCHLSIRTDYLPLQAQLELDVAVEEMARLNARYEARAREQTVGVLR
jgi:hypothetical protein